jgi:molecular chaperone DnaK (HSP70)
MRFLLGYPATNQSHNVLESLYAPIDFVENSRGGFSGIYGDNRQISIEELFATTLRYIKQIAEKDANEPVSEYTITVS